MLFTYIKKDFSLSIRNIFVILVFLFPILISLGASGILETYSTSPKMVVLEKEKELYSFPHDIKVYVVENEEELKKKVYDIDTKIGLLNQELVIDGRESDTHIEQAKMLLEGKAIDSNRVNETIFEKVFAFNLYGSLIFSGIMILFSLVEERAHMTTELLKTHPVHPIVPILSKIVVVGAITTIDFVICSFLLNAPLQLSSFLVLGIGMLLGSILGLTLAFYASNETQALAILKPVSLVYLMAIPGLGFFVEGIMHTIALFTNPFYWLLQLVHGLYQNQLDSLYVLLSIALGILALTFISLNWHRTPYGVKKYM